MLNTHICNMGKAALHRAILVLQHSLLLPPGRLTTAVHFASQSQQIQGLPHPASEPLAPTTHQHDNKAFLL